MKFPVSRTAHRIFARLQAHQNLRLAVMVTHGCVRTFDVSSESLDGLGRHYSMVGVYDGGADPEQIGSDIEYVMALVESKGIT